MQLTRFDGGLSTRLDAHLIEPTQARTFVNIDNSKGTLRPIKDKLVSSITATGRFAYYFIAGGQWYFNDSITDYVEFQKRLYYSDRIGRPKKILADIEYNLGVEKPIVSGNVSVTNGPNAITRATFTATVAAGDLPISTVVSYKLVNFNLAGFRSNESVTFSVTTAAALGKVTIGGLDTNFSNRVEIYRLFDGFYRKVGEILTAAGTFVDNVYNISANSTLDSVPGVLNGTINYALTNYSSVDGAESIPTFLDQILAVNGVAFLSSLPVSTDPQVDKKYIYRVGGNLTVYTLVAIIPNTQTTFTDNIEDDEVDGSLLTSSNYEVPIAGLKYLIESYAMLFGAVENRLYFTPIAQPNAWPTNFYLDFSTEITGIGKTPIGLLVFTLYETYLVTGTGPASLTQQILSGDQGCISHDSIKNVKGASIWCSTDGVCISGGSEVKVVTKDRLDKLELSVVNSALFDQEYYVQQTDGTTFVIDFDREIFKKMEYGIDSLAVANDKIYGHFDGNLYELEKGPLNLTFSYLSPKLHFSSLTISKAFKTIYVYSEGEITFKVFVDDVLVQTKNFSSTGINQVMIPNTKTVANYYQFEISGTGAVLEIRIDPGAASI